MLSRTIKIYGCSQNDAATQWKRFFQNLGGCAVLLALCAAPYCGAAADIDPLPGSGTPAVQFTQIVFSDSGGFTGRGTGKWLSIAGDGKLQLKKRDGAMIEVQLTKQELADLAIEVAAVDWSSVQKQYRSRGADMIQNDLVVTIGGRPHATHAVVGSAEIPPPLKTLFSRLATLYRQFAPTKK